MRRGFSDSDTPAAIEVGGQMYKGRSSECFRDRPIRRTAASAAAATENISAIGPGSALSLRRSLAEAEQRLTCSRMFLEAAHLALSHSQLAHVTSRLAVALCEGWLAWAGEPPKATKCYSLTAWQLTLLLYASDQQYIEAPKGSLLGVDREGAAGHFPEAARRHRELRMVGLSSFRPQLSRSG